MLRIWPHRAMAENAEPDARAGRISFTLVFLRLLVCSFGFLAAVLIAGLVGTFALYRGLEGDAAYEAAFIGTAILAVLAAAYSALLPFGALIIITEAFRIRGVLVYAIGGMAVALYHGLVAIGADVGLTDRRLVIAAATGIVGGCVYWLVAGRSAGAYRERRYPARASSIEPESPEA